MRKWIEYRVRNGERVELEVKGERKSRESRK